MATIINTNRKVFMTGLTLLAILLPTLQCSSIRSVYQKTFMKGRIVELSNSEYLISIGTAENLKVGQVLKVYKYDTAAFLYDDEPRTYEKRYTGTIKIISFENKYFARTALISGTAMKGSFVELK